MIENSTSLLQEITNVINKEEIVNLNLTEGKEYLITFDKTTKHLSLKSDIKDVIFIKNITFCNIKTAINDLLKNTLFERFMNNGNVNINSEFENWLLSKFDFEQRIEIKYGLSKNLDVSKYAILDENQNSIFNAEQMTEIRKGLEENIDISIYDKKEISFNEMKKIRIHKLGRDGICEECNSTKNVKWVDEPFALDVYNNIVKVWICDNCYAENCEDI